MQAGRLRSAICCAINILEKRCSFVYISHSYFVRVIVEFGFQDSLYMWYPRMSATILKLETVIFQWFYFPIVHCKYSSPPFQLFATFQKPCNSILNDIFFLTIALTKNWSIYSTTTTTPITLFVSYVRTGWNGSIGLYIASHLVAE